MKTLGHGSKKINKIGWDQKREPWQPGGGRAWCCRVTAVTEAEDAGGGVSSTPIHQRGTSMIVK